MNLSQFQFQLPPELIAQDPLVPRDSARLFVYDRLSDTVTHALVRDLPSFLPTGSLLVANNSRVRKARLFARSESGKPVELLVLEALDATLFRCMIGGRGVRPGDSLQVFTKPERDVPAPLTALVERSEDLPGMTCFQVRLTPHGDKTAEQLIEDYGQAPLPPYITKSQAKDEQYQTVYADPLGSAAAPTAGLHFTPELLERLGKTGIGWAEVTLHVGLGTFLPLRHETIEENKLHSEHTIISQETALRVAETRRQGKPVLAIGTTSTRTLESHSGPAGLVAGDLATDMFIYPGYRFQTVTALMTNFHLPHSSLLMLVSAFLGNRPDNSGLLLKPEEMPARLLRLYEEAIRERYRFFSFGDAMLIL